MANFDQERRAAFQLEQAPNQLEELEHRSDVRKYYEKLAIHTLLSMRRQWFFIVSPVALAALAALIVIPLLPRKYSATALVVPSLYSQEQGKTVPLAGIEAAAIVNGEARLVVSDPIIRAAARRLWPEPHPEAGSAWLSAWLKTMFFPETQTESPLDRQLTALRKRLEVVKDTRSYLIAVSTTASSADEAAQIVNTVAVEYARDKLAQRRRDAVAAAESELTRQRAVYGDKHPKVLQAVEALGASRNELEVVMDPDARTDEGIRLALPNHTPASPKGTTILGVSLILGMLAGVGLAIWRDRRGVKPVDLGMLAGVGLAIWRDRRGVKLVGFSGGPLITWLRDRLVRASSQHEILRHIRADIRSLFSRRPQEIPCIRELERPACEASNDTTSPLRPPPLGPPDAARGSAFWKKRQ